MFNVDGRIGRQKWWTIIILPSIALGIMFYFIGENMKDSNDWAICLGPIFFLVSLGVFVAIIAPASIKRLHDINQSGKLLWGLFIFIPLMPLIFFIPFGTVLFPLALLYLGFKEGTDGENNYGEKPSEVSS